MAAACASIPRQPADSLNTCHVGRSLSLQVAIVVVVDSDVIEDRNAPQSKAAMLRKTRFVLACPLLVIGIAFVLPPLRADAGRPARVRRPLFWNAWQTAM